LANTNQTDIGDSLGSRVLFQRVGVQMASGGDVENIDSLDRAPNQFCVCCKKRAMRLIKIGDTLWKWRRGSRKSFVQPGIALPSWRMT
jgi:hypothetical protein